MTLRRQQARLPDTSDDLWGIIGREAIIGIAKEKVTGLFRRA